MQDITANGAVQPLREALIPFAAGSAIPSTVDVFRRAHGFQAGALLARPDGGLLALGGAPIVKGTGEGEGFATVPLAEARLQADDTLDPTFGGPLQPATVDVALYARRAATAARTRLVIVRFRGSGPGSAIVRVRDTHGRILAEDVTVVVDRSYSTRALIPLTRQGRKLITGHRPVRVIVGVKFRDVTGAVAGATVPSALR